MNKMVHSEYDMCSLYVNIGVFLSFKYGKTSICAVSHG